MEVNSKGIRWIRYDERTRTLDVAYTNSGEYRYERLDGEQVSSGESDLEQLLRDSLQSEKSEED